MKTYILLVILGYITKTEYLALLAEGQRKATGKTKELF